MKASRSSSLLRVLEGLALLVGDDVGHVLVQPGLVGALQLLPDGLLRGKLLLVGALALERVHFLILAIGRLRHCWRLVRLLGEKPGGGGKDQAATQCDDEKMIAVQHHLP